MRNGQRKLPGADGATDLGGEPPTAEVQVAEPGAEPEPYEPAEALPIDDPSLQRRLARIHLKTGSMALARAELETLAGHGQLDTGALLDLAEVRWRTGDLHGAGEAAASYLNDGGDEALGFVIAAEAAVLSNRLDEARLHAEKALERHMAELDPVFAGMPRKATWSLPRWRALAVPAAPAAEAPPVAAAAAEPATARALEPIDAAEPAVADPGEPAVAPASESDQVGAELASGRSCLEADDPMMAAFHFGVAIRIAPGSARAALDAIGERHDLPLQLVRGDALRILGLEGEARTAYQSVASALGAPKPVTPEPTIEAVDAPSEPPAAASEPESEGEPSAVEALPVRWD